MGILSSKPELCKLYSESRKCCRVPTWNEHGFLRPSVALPPWKQRLYSPVCLSIRSGRVDCRYVVAHLRWSMCKSLHRSQCCPCNMNFKPFTKSCAPSGVQIDSRGSSPGGRMLPASRLEILSHVVGLSRAVREAFHFCRVHVGQCLRLRVWGYGVSRIPHVLLTAPTVRLPYAHCCIRMGIAFGLEV